MENTLNELKNILQSALEGKKNFFHEFTNQYVLVRSAPSGVHIGYLKDYNEFSNSVILENSRRIHYWEKAFTLTAIAKNGLNNDCKDIRLSESIDKIGINYICEIIPCSLNAKENLINYRTHTI